MTNKVGMKNCGHCGKEFFWACNCIYKLPKTKTRPAMWFCRYTCYKAEQDLREKQKRSAY